MKSWKSQLAACLVALGGISAQCDLTPGARYFSGQMNVSFSAPTACYLELLYSPDLSTVTVRSISTLPHLSTSGQPVLVGLGPYNARFLAPRGLYRYQDSTPGATVRDLIINTSGQTTPTRLGVQYWHAEAGHHDPMFCDGLSEATSQSQLEVMDAVFANFENIKR